MDSLLFLLLLGLVAFLWFIASPIRAYSIFVDMGEGEWAVLTMIFGLVGFGPIFLMIALFKRAGLM